MAKQTITIGSILGGIASAQYFAGEEQYNSAIAIDPDYPIGSGVKTSGAICPTVYDKFSGAGVTGYPKWIVNNPKNTLTYVYASDGKVVSYDSALGSETAVGTPTSGAGNGSAYYNNYVYFATPTDVSRLGPLNGSPSLANTFWTSTLSKTALTNTTYPSLRGTPIPNHAMHVHGDNNLYFCDFINGQGLIHKINTKKVTAEGDTDGTTSPSAYNVLDLPFGYYPTDIESYGTDLAVLAIQTVDSTVNQGRAALFLWDTTSSSFYRQIALQDPIATALLYHNGTLHIWSGNAVNGVRLSAYLGGETIRQIIFLEEGTPPFAGAVDVMANKVVFGGWTTTPSASASVFSFGSKNELLPKGTHNVVKTTSTGANQNVTALKSVLQSSNIKPQIVAGWGDDSAKGIDKLSTTGTFSAIWRSEVFNVGQPFSIQKIRIPLAKEVATNMTVTPKVYLDDDVTTGTALNAINTTYFSGKRNATYKGTDLKGLQAQHNIMLELNFAGTVSLPVIFPIIIEIDKLED
jgi:hypothetical protein